MFSMYNEIDKKRREAETTDKQIDRIIRSHRKTVSLEITSDAKLIVRAPLYMSENLIRRTVGDKSEWIEAKMKLAEARSTLYPPVQCLEGETLWFLGSEYRLRFTGQVQSPEIRENCLLFPSDAEKDAVRAVTAWYKAQARSVITGRVNLYAGLNSLSYKSLGISSARKRWGSCGADRSLNFSWRLVMAPVQAIDYVVVHELAHICHHDHSKAFWAKVAQMMPDYGACRQWLCDNSGILRAL